MTNRVRLLVLGALTLVLVIGTGAWIAVSRARQDPATPGTADAGISVTSVSGAPRVVFRNTALGPQYGRVAMVPLSDTAGPRAYTSRSCDRVFATTAEMLCLASDRGLVTTYSATVYADATGAGTSLPLTGSPSRARLSGDGRYAATTSFIAGDSYAATSFSTRTVISRVDDRTSWDLEDFTLVDQGSTVTPVDRNYWGVTFAADDDHFYVTVAFAGSTHLARGQVSTRRVESVRTDAECPSLSPDGTRVAYKKRGDRARGDWRLAVLDLRTGVETVLPETRSVDDQVEWLDDARVLYGLPGEGSDAAESNVWMASADGSGAPSLLIPKAWSPAVVR